ncbi:MAG: hypothetical protein ACP5P4_12310 [Steroidobacteraceae bacterium]
MATAAYDMTDSLDVRVARLESDVAHIGADISDLKIDLRQMREELSTHRSETHAGFKALDARVTSFQAEVNGEFKAVRYEMQQEFKSVRCEMQTGFSAVHAEMAALGRETLKREWAILTLMVTLFLALLGVMLRGFGWIG